jgi:hypothetical protein
VSTGRRFSPGEDRWRGRSGTTATVLSARTEERVGQVLVVGAAAQLQVVERRPPARRERHRMVIELEEGTLTAPATAGPDEHAAAAVAQVHRPLHLRGDMS